MLEGAVRATPTATASSAPTRLRSTSSVRGSRAVLGDEAYEDARREGAVLDGDAAVEHALRAL